MHPHRRALLAALGTTLLWSIAPGRVDAQSPGTPPLFDPGTVRDYHLRFADANWEALLAATGEDGNIRADLTVDGEVYEEIGVRYKGLSSARVQGRKKPFNLSIDAFAPGQRLLGYDTVNLNNGYADPSFVREALAYGALQNYMPTPDTAYVRLHVNGAYFSLYLGVEQIERTFLDRWFPGSDGILIKGDPPNPFGPRFLAQAEGAGGPAGDWQSGDLMPLGRGLRPDRQPGPQQQPGGGGLGADLTWKGEDIAQYQRFYEVKTNGAADEGFGRLRDMIRVLDAPVSAGGVSDADFPEAIGKVLDVDRALWYIAANNLFVNFDSYYFAHNYFLYWTEEDQRFHILIWDTNMSFGSFNFPGASPTGPLAQADPFHMATTTTRPLIRRLLAVPAYKADYMAHFRTLLDEAFDPQAIEASAVAMQARVRADVQADPNRLYSVELFDQNLREDVRSGQGARASTTAGVLKLAGERHAWLTSRADFQSPDHDLAAHARAPEQPGPDAAATIGLRVTGADVPVAVQLVYRVNDGPPASVEMAPDGDAWTGTIPGQSPGRRVAYYARAAFADGRSAFHPAANLTQPWRYTVAGPDLPVTPGGDIVINEIMADNDATIADPAGEFDDWMEIHNRGTSPVSLKGYFVGKDAVDPWAYALPDVTLAPGAHYLVWCDKDAEQGPDHAPFNLGKAGDSVLLSTRTATVDSVTFGAQATDESFARLPDGSETWSVCGHATPGRANRCDAPTPTPSPMPSPTPEGRGRTVFLPVGWKP